MQTIWRADAAARFDAEAATLQTAGISAADAAALRDFYRQQLELAQTGGSGGGSYRSESGGSGTGSDTGAILEVPADAYTSYEAARGYLQSLGAPEEVMNSLMSREVWNQEKGEPNATKRGHTAATEAYNSYEDYLYDLIYWAINK